MNDLFDKRLKAEFKDLVPLAERMRPDKLEDSG